MQSNRQLAIAKVNEVCALATKLYGVDLSNLQLRFDLKGRAAGQAQLTGQRQIVVRLNDGMLHHTGADHVINNTVPHEIAHIVCFLRRELGHGHDAGWQRVCLALGGNGETRHKEEVVFGKGLTYEYTATCGTKVRISERIHRSIQAGAGRMLRRTRGRINQSCAFEIVGASGRHFDAPVQAAPVQAAPVQAAPVQRAVKRDVGTASKAELIRARIAQAKARCEPPELVVQFGVDVLSMTRALASTYVKNNWNKA